jgi:predicted nucleotidyltransferase
VEFERLLDAVSGSPDLLTVVKDLLRRKRDGAELDRGPKIPVINDFIERGLANVPPMQTERLPASAERLNETFRSILGRVWEPDASRELTT